MVLKMEINVSDMKTSTEYSLINKVHLFVHITSISLFLIVLLAFYHYSVTKKELLLWANEESLSFTLKLILFFKL
jgi:hypothetical protein